MTDLYHPALSARSARDRRAPSRTTRPAPTPRHPASRGHPPAPPALGAGHHPRLPQRDLRLERPPRVRDPPDHQDARQLHRRRPHRHLRPGARQHHGPEPAARLGQRPRAGPGRRRPRRRHPVHRRVDPASACSCSPSCRSIDDVLKHSTRGLVFSGATGVAGRRGDPRRWSRTAGPERVGHLFKLLGLMAQRPRRRVGDRGQRVDGPPRRRRRAQRRRGRPELHLLQPHRRHPADHRRAPGLHVGADLLQVLQAGHRPDLQQHGQEAAGGPRAAAARLHRPPRSPGWPRSAATTTWPTSTASSWPRWAAPRRPTGGWSRR